MYKDNTIDLIWDNSSPIDSSTMGFLSKAGFRPYTIALGDIPTHLSAQEAGPYVVCVQGRDSSSLDFIQRLRAQYGNAIYVVLRVEPNEVDLAIEAVKVGVDDVISAVIDFQNKWDKVAELARKS